MTTTPYTDEELNEMYSDGEQHRMQPGEALTIMVPHKDVTEAEHGS